MVPATAHRRRARRRRRGRAVVDHAAGRHVEERIADPSGPAGHQRLRRRRRARSAAHPRDRRRGLPRQRDAPGGDALRIGERLGADTAYLDAYQGHAALAMAAGTLLGWATVMHGGCAVDCDRAPLRRRDLRLLRVRRPALAARPTARPGSSSTAASTRRAWRSRTTATPSSPGAAVGPTTSPRSPAPPAPTRTRLARDAGASARAGAQGGEPDRVRPRLLGAAARAAVRRGRGGAGAVPHAGRAASSTSTPGSSTPAGRPMPGLYASGGAAAGHLRPRRGRLPRRQRAAAGVRAGLPRRRAHRRASTVSAP